jgi:asparagine synthase (glutamine-hydrolysing)
MCGFLGWFGDRPSDTDLAAGLQAIAHRGPDDRGIEQSQLAWLGFRRLAILDLSPCGHQPMRFGDGRFVLLFNGEIYNFEELRAKYLDGVPLRSPGDTAVLGALLERLPFDRVLHELRGMFAFVWWDSHENILRGARDHFGIKPLYFAARRDGTLGVASELRALDIATGYQAELDPSGIRDYFRWGAVQAPRTILADFTSLLPGHSFTWTVHGGLTVSEWFQPVWQREVARKSPEAWRQEAREVILESVRAHLISDVPVGVFLSSGLDSTLIACALRQLGAGEIQAFSIGYESDAGVEDESAAARQTAGFLDAKFEAAVITENEVFNSFDAYVRALDQPTGDGLNTYLVSRLAGAHVKVALSGLGADEMFAGYRFYRMLQASRRFGLRSPLARHLLLPAINQLSSWEFIGSRSQAARKIASFSRAIMPRELDVIYRQWRGVMSEERLDRLVGPPLETDSRGAAPGHREILRRGGSSEVHRLLALELDSYLPNTLLRDNDGMSMAHSLELRTPFVDLEVFNFSARSPAWTKLDGASGKKILREAFYHELPSWIRDERRKKTFTLPLMKWLRSPDWQRRIRNRFTDRESVIASMGGKSELDGLSHQFASSQAIDKSNWLLSQRVWLAMVFESWCAERANAKANRRAERERELHA